MNKTAERTLAEIVQRIHADPKDLEQRLLRLLDDVKAMATASGLHVVDAMSSERQFYVNVCRENDVSINRGLLVRANLKDIEVIGLTITGANEERLVLEPSELVQRGRQGLFGPRTVRYPDGTDDLEPAIDAVARAIDAAEKKLDETIGERRSRSRG